MFNQPYPGLLFPNNHLSQPNLAKFPDSRDRTPNEPSVFLHSFAILHYYNSRNLTSIDDTNNKEFDSSLSILVTDDVKNWLNATAIKHGWSRVLFTGNQCLLTADISLITDKKEL